MFARRFITKSSTLASAAKLVSNQSIRTTKSHSVLVTPTRTMASTTFVSPSSTEEYSSFGGQHFQQVTKTILKDRPVDPAIQWKVNPSTDKFLDTATKSFAGSPSTKPEEAMEWALTGIVPPEMDHPDRPKVYNFVMTEAVRENLAKGRGLIFGHGADAFDVEGDSENVAMTLSSSSSREEDSNGMASAVFMLPYDPSEERQKAAKEATLTGRIAKSFHDIALFGGAALEGRLPKQFYSYQALTSIAKKFDKFANILKRNHLKYGPSEPHLYVNIVAMDPAFQGRGYGKQLMSQVEAIADAMDQPAYLECSGERNPRFYEKFGFEIVHEENMVIDDDGSSFPMYFMTRPKRA